MLPPDQAAAARKTLRDLSVAVFVVKTVREQLRYDTPRLVVEAGKPFEIIFVNDDVMPHNLLVVKPGSQGRNRHPLGHHASHPGQRTAAPTSRRATRSSPPPNSSNPTSAPPSK